MVGWSARPAVTVKMGNRVESQELRRYVVRVDSEDRQPQGTGFFVALGWARPPRTS